MSKHQILTKRTPPPPTNRKITQTTKGEERGIEMERAFGSEHGEGTGDVQKEKSPK